MPAATAAEAPPLDPPALWLGFQGLRVGPKRAGSVVAVKAELGRVAAPDDDDPGRLQALDQRAVVVGDEAVEEPAAVGDRRAGVELIEILHQVGHAGEGSGRKAARDLAPRNILEHEGDRVEARIPVLDPVEGRIRAPRPR